MKKKLLGIIITLITMLAIISINTNAKAVNEEQLESIEKLRYVIDTSNKSYAGENIEPKVELYDGNKQLVNNVDYSVSYEDNFYVGKAKIIVEGKEKYDGVIEKHFYIVPEGIQIESITANSNCTAVDIKWKSNRRADGYEIFMSGEKDGKYTKIATAAGETNTSYYKKGLSSSKTYYFKIRAYRDMYGKRFTGFFGTQKTYTRTKSIEKLRCVVDTSNHTYTGKVVKTKVDIYDGNIKLTDKVDFNVSYENNFYVGKAKAIIQGKGKYSGTIGKYFYIVPEGVQIKSVIGNYNLTAVDIEWERNNRADGYEIFMSGEKDGKYTKIATVEGETNTDYYKKGLSSLKSYYFKIRAYRDMYGKRFTGFFGSPKTYSGMISKVSLISNSSGANRNHNLALACDKIDGEILYPGETFNWFKVVGPASAANGYRKAIVYSNGKSIQGYGGGVCQVSTTLYQASLKAELQIVERHLHSKPVSYTTWGKDATVSYGVQNLRIKNNKNYKIKIVMYANGGRTTCELYKIL